MNNLIRFTLRGQDLFFNIENEIASIVEEQDSAIDGIASIITLKNGRQIVVDQSPNEIFQILKLSSVWVDSGKCPFCNKIVDKTDK